MQKPAKIELSMGDVPINTIVTCVRANTAEKIAKIIWKSQLFFSFVVYVKKNNTKQTKKEKAAISEIIYLMVPSKIKWFVYIIV
ncbi:MAG: hypothetical protein A2725_02730 [Candidatus Magasanikbacteria bacterium RIFCSPHIGHO2_01_FULL_33_34]|uniref:Uncharacterized protein n=1 Tax=Candidatus Magasanikbacteria bacterium RIFCSPHIGHO2_01_FULL_33_34 TaxID=1798671 RepID=A0A1F6LGR0_9BACT|nr:MAG: hypothetical protein A2725_02730 [Candidatus Magasanikbacteria bacterium RIFCSPHIGHO2_01_FULL_33_34]OGH66051.1 MAG: hypothetical protein A3B83_00220 [Candidatus Magasanikbacteria bacterium RIFCSPHIGHO2_02_FULL_33_17]OGH75897.1 MAG: hypothetical protein A3A89_00130 [Candidatus Magasanikbacteria bacterium RIFCSPLOWO2_01_FULL_33_34]OGH81674.1 MAG: hypothetical protein A3F93_01925 [Candidatus Magasanikbacteria bacterium RIFCSPLOWO2_12_FULL_34_7]